MEKITFLASWITVSWLPALEPSASYKYQSSIWDKKKKNNLFLWRFEPLLKMFSKLSISESILNVVKQLGLDNSRERKKENIHDAEALWIF